MLKIDAKEYKFFGLPIFLFIFFLAGFLQLYNLGVPSIYADEAFTIWIAKFNASAIISYLFTDAHPPFYFLLLHCWIKLFGDGEFATRLLSVIFNMGTLIVIYALCNELFKDKKYGLLSSFLFAISSLSIIDIGTEVKMYGLLMFLTILSVYLLCKLINANDIRKTKLWILYVLILILLLYTHYFAFFVIFAELMCMALLYKPQNTARAYYYAPLLIIFILLLAFLPWSRSFFHQLFVVHSGGGDFRISFLKSSIFRTAHLFYYFFTIFIFKTPIWAIYVSGALLFALTLFGAIRILKYKNGGIVSLFFFTNLIIPYILSCVSHKRLIFLPKYLSLIYPFFIILSVCGILNLRGKYLKYALTVSLITVFAACNFTNYYKYVSDSRYWKQNWRSAAQYIEERSGPKGIILLQPSFNVFAFNYYYENNLMGIKALKKDLSDEKWNYDFDYTARYFTQGGMPQITNDFYFDPQYLKRQTEGYNKIYYILYDMHIIDPRKKVLIWLCENYTFLEGVSIESFYRERSNIYIGIFTKK